jgi:type 1 glutamine amidotransferase
MRTIAARLVGCAALFAGTAAVLLAQQTPPAPRQGAPGGGRGFGGRGGGVAPALFTAADANKDAALTRDELKTAFDAWFAAAGGTASGSITRDQLATAITAALPPPPAPAAAQGPPCGGRSSNPQTACPDDVAKMMAALPSTAPAKPAKPRKVLVLSKSQGFVHSSIPLAAKMMEEMGKKTGAWTATTTYDPADINAKNLEQYDLIFLNSTTGEFLDDPANPAVTAERKKAFLDFIRNGKGIAGIHAASDSYHGNPNPAPRGGGPGGGGPGGGRGAFGPGPTLATLMVSQADKNSDQSVSKAELTALADTWFDKLDPDKAGRVGQADFPARYASLQPPPAAPPAGGAPGGRGGGPQVNVGLWPEWNRIIGGWFKYHWNDPQHIVVKIDDPKSPLTAMFKGQSFDIYDETYTFPMESWSRENIHVLTSVDYSKMSDEDKAKEPAGARRTDGDYGLSWIRREGKGRMFYEAHGHNEKIYAMTPMLEHILAGVQYAIGDLKADDSPTVKPKGTK